MVNNPCYNCSPLSAQREGSSIRPSCDPGVTSSLQSFWLLCSQGSLKPLYLSLCLGPSLTLYHSHTPLLSSSNPLSQQSVQPLLICCVVKTNFAQIHKDIFKFFSADSQISKDVKYDRLKFGKLHKMLQKTSKIFNALDEKAQA